MREPQTSRRGVGRQVDPAHDPAGAGVEQRDDGAPARPGTPRSSRGGSCAARPAGAVGAEREPGDRGGVRVGLSVRSRSRLRASKSWTCPALSPTASRRPPGSTAALSTVASPARITPINAGLRSSVPSRLPRVRARVVERDALAGEQQRAVELVVEQRAGAEPLRLRRGRLAAGVPALIERHRAGDHGHDEQRADAGEDRAQAALRAVRGGGALGEELALGRVEVRLVGARPLERRGEPRTPVELARVTAAGVPVARRRCAGERAAAAPARPPRASREASATRAAAPRARPRPRRHRP